MQASPSWKGGEDSRSKYWEKHWLQQVDGEKKEWYVATPFRCPPGATLLTKFCQTWVATYLDCERILKKHLEYNSNMKLLRDLVIQEGLRKSVTAPSVFSPLHYSFKNQVIEASHADKFQGAWHHSVAVNNFWQSSRGPSTTLLPSVEAGSAWDTLVKEVFVTCFNWTLHDII